MSDLELDADALITCASALGDTVAEVRAGSTPPPTPPVPRWQSTDAAEHLSQSTEEVLADLAGDLAAFRLAVLAAVADYEAADRRAAQRLGLGG
jgi:hypothetical protein